jgi:hypothetical protein
MKALSGPHVARGPDVAQACSGVTDYTSDPSASIVWMRPRPPTKKRLSKMNIFNNVHCNKIILKFKAHRLILKL